jgi:putative transposase
MRFAFIDAWKEVWPVEFLCRVMKVTSRGFRAWRIRPMSQRQRDDMVLLAHIREQHRLSLQSYGRPRMTEELQELGLNVGLRHVGRLMGENGIKIIRTQKYKTTTIARQAIARQSAERGIAITRSTSPPICWIRISQLLAQTRNGQATYPISGPVKVGFILCVSTHASMCENVAVILDLYSRRVTGWAVSNRMKRDLAIRALDMAVALRQPLEGCIHHTDRGSQYCSNDYQRRLSKHGFKVSPLTHVNMCCRAVHEW